jgi:dTDP-4-dehydrorhamnose reductase
MSRLLIVLGSRGMLGQMVKRYFSEQGFEVSCYDQHFGYEDRSAFSAFLKTLRSAIVINCIGKIKQKTNEASELVLANTLLPATLRNNLHKDIILIHPSTDCVFNGRAGAAYPVSHEADAEDDYGWSKRMGEVVLEGRPNTLIPRVSIIGPDHNPAGRGLLAWVKSNAPGSQLQGYTDHLWNGITTLEWCRQIHQYIQQNKNFPFRLIQWGTAGHSTKYEMLVLFNKLFELGLRIQPVETADPIDRRLVPDIICKPLPEQLQDLHPYF